MQVCGLAVLLASVACPAVILQGCKSEKESALKVDSSSASEQRSNNQNDLDNFDKVTNVEQKEVFDDQ